jgi:diadenosine tetraphosphate (Ap4A) HIT family hydrolase
MATDRVKWRRKGLGTNRGVLSQNTNTHTHTHTHIHTHISPESRIEDDVMAFVSKSAFVEREAIPKRMRIKLNSVYSLFMRVICHNTRC